MGSAGNAFDPNYGTDAEGASNDPGSWHAANYGQAWKGDDRSIAMSLFAPAEYKYYNHLKTRKRYLARQNEAQERAEISARGNAQGEQINGLPPGLQYMVSQAQQQNGGGALHPAQMAQIVQQYKMNVQRQQTGNAINQYFMNPALAQQRQAYVQGVEKDAYGDLADQTRMASREAAFQTAGRGQMGSSIEAERTGRIAQVRDQGAARIGANTQGTLQQMAARDRQRRAQLLQMAYGDDPNAARMAAAQLQGLQQQAGFEQDAAGVEEAYGKIQQQASDSYAAALGSGLSAVGAGYKNYRANYRGA